MKRDDWIGLGASVGGHLALVLAFAFLTTERPPAPSLGVLQVEIGAFAEGRPVQQTETPESETEAATAEAPTPPEEEAPAPSTTPSGAAAEEQEAAPSTPPASESAPVDLPEQEDPAKGEEPPPEEPPAAPEEEAPPAQEPSESPEETAPAQEEAPADADAQSASSPEERASQREATAPQDRGGQEEGAASGAPSGEEGTGDDAEEASPFDIEGLDRNRLYGPMPQYTEKVDATIKVEIIVGPQGSVVGQRLLRKGNPSLERSVMEALQQWRFNRLPGGAPQENQTGVVTFRFRLE